MTNILQQFLSQFGLKLNRYPRSEYEYLLKKPRYRNTTVKLNGMPFEIADCPSFYYSHREIFMDQIYKFDSANNQPMILDCGSNYGTSIVYFKQLYPNANIIGVEADPQIFELLVKNVASQSFKGVTLLNKAISIDPESVVFHVEGADGGRIHNIENSTQTYEVDTVLLDELITGPIDFLKMDIEGAETDVLTHSKKLNKVDQLFIEYHSFVDADQGLGKLLTLLTKHSFRYYIHTQFCSTAPLTNPDTQLGMDLQLNIFAKKQ